MKITHEQWKHYTITHIDHEDGRHETHYEPAITFRDSEEYIKEKNINPIN